MCVCKKWAGVKPPQEKKPDEIIRTIKQNEIINIRNAKNILVAATKKEILVIQEQC